MPNKPVQKFQGELEAAAIEAQVSRIVSSSFFVSSSRAKRFLEYVVAELLAGRSDRLKGYSIALEVFDQSEDFDSESNPIVRVEAGRLRQKLAGYYSSEGENDPIIIEIPKGSYVPTFEANTRQKAASTSMPGNKKVFAAVSVLVAVVAAVLFWFFKPGGSDLSQPPLGSEVIVFHTSGPNPESAEITRALTLFRHDLMHALRQYSELQIIEDRGRDLSSFPFSRYAIVETGMHQHEDEIDITVNVIRHPVGDALMIDEIEFRPEVGHESEFLHEVAEKIAIQIAAPLGAMSDMARQDIELDDAAQDANRCIFYSLYIWRRPSQMAHQDMVDCVDKMVLDFPQSATAWAAKSMAHLDAARYLIVSHNEIVPEIKMALSSARMSNGIDSSNPSAKRALYSVMFALGRTSEFERLSASAIEANDHNIHTLADVARLEAMAGQLERARELAQEALTHGIDVPEWFYLAEAHILMSEGDYVGVLQQLANINWSTDFDYLLLKIVALSALEQGDEAKITLARLFNEYPKMGDRVEDLFDMWNFEASVAAVYRTQLARHGFQFSVSGSDWAETALSILTEN